MPPSEELRALLALHVTMVLEHRQALSVSLTERRSPGPDRWAVIRAKRDRIEAFVVDCLVRGRESGEFGAVGPPRLLAYTLLGMCYWGNQWFRPDGRWSVEQIVDTIAAVALDGVRG
jgi:hypothetical protein